MRVLRGPAPGRDSQAAKRGACLLAITRRITPWTCAQRSVSTSTATAGAAEAEVEQLDARFAVAAVPEVGEVGVELAVEGQGQVLEVAVAGSGADQHAEWLGMQERWCPILAQGVEKIHGLSLKYYETGLIVIIIEKA